MAILEKTEAGREALSATARLLTPRERTMVLLADGRRTLQEVCGMVTGATPETLYSLHERGFLYIGPSPAADEPARTKRRPRPVTTTEVTQPGDGEAPSGWSRNTLIGLDTLAPEPERVPSPLANVPTDVPTLAEPIAEAAPIEAMARIRWARTPAATKLYLMDVVERTFASSDRAHWERLRDMLREVRDEDSLALAMDMVTLAVQDVAGDERAQALRQQLVL
jgi:hypothetical protein